MPENKANGFSLPGWLAHTSRTTVGAYWFESYSRAWIEDNYRKVFTAEPIGVITYAGISRAS